MTLSAFLALGVLASDRHRPESLITRDSQAVELEQRLQGEVIALQAVSSICISVPGRSRINGTLHHDHT
jgi:hypothetical protein